MIGRLILSQTRREVCSLATCLCRMKSILFPYVLTVLKQTFQFKHQSFWSLDLFVNFQGFSSQRQFLKNKDKHTSAIPGVLVCKPLVYSFLQAHKQSCAWQVLTVEIKWSLWILSIQSTLDSWFYRSCNYFLPTSRVLNSSLKPFFVARFMELGAVHTLLNVLDRSSMCSQAESPENMHPNNKTDYKNSYP